MLQDGLAFDLAHVEAAAVARAAWKLFSTRGEVMRRNDAGLSSRPSIRARSQRARSDADAQRFPAAPSQPSASGIAGSIGPRANAVYPRARAPTFDPGSKAECVMPAGSRIRSLRNWPNGLPLTFSTTRPRST